jgi:hypothetical protein
MKKRWVRKNMKAPVLIILFIISSPYLLFGQLAQSSNANTIASAIVKLLDRHYQDGERLSYHMKATNKNKTKTLSYEVDAIGVVKKDANDHFYEEYEWTNLLVNAKKIILPSVSLNYRQQLSLDPNYEPSVPKLAPSLVGPILDFLTFYVDLGMATQRANLAHVGDHFYFKYGKPASWANGSVILGEDSVDFYITLKEVDRVRQIATVVVRHVPPIKSEIKIPADWMRVPVANTPNNWVQVTKDGDKYIATVGKETFDCEIKVSLVDGKMLSATMDNPVEVIERECTDKALADYGSPVRYEIRRQIDLSLTH